MSDEFNGADIAISVEEQERVKKVDGKDPVVYAHHDKKNIRDLPIRKYTWVGLDGKVQTIDGTTVLSLTLQELIGECDFTDTDIENIIVMNVGDNLFFTAEDRSGITRLF